jgi:acyl-CoA thioester hydrolase
MSATTLQVRVRYAETDQMGVVYYANYLVWFELGRVEVLRALGLSYHTLEVEHQCVLPVVEASCRYRAPARYDDLILIEARPSMLRGSVLKFAYKIWRENEGPVQNEEERKLLLAEGETVHVVCDAHFNRKPLPEQYVTALKALME